MSTNSQSHRQLLPCNWLISQLPGLSAENVAQLQECDITTTISMLEKTCTKEQKQILANQLKINVQYINKWVALADLARIPSVNYQYCGLLLHAGIVSVKQLAETPIHRLHPQILRLQVAMLQRRDLCPSIQEVQTWLQQAQLLIVNC